MTSRPRMLIFGAQGMLGSQAMRAFAERYVVIGRDIDQLDITDAAAVQQTVREIGPAVVLNCAADTAVDACEERPERAELVNGVAAGTIAAASRDVGALMVQISTDYVFDGRGDQPYRETDAPNPLSVYGRSKWLGEQQVTQRAGDYLIARTAWLYGPGGRHFVETIRQRLASEALLRVVDDQVGSPTSTAELCRQLGALLRHDCRGVYHTVCDGYCSWFEFAQAIARLRNSATPIAPCASTAFPRPAPRPANSRLSTEKLRADTGYQPTHWRQALAAYLEG